MLVRITKTTESLGWLTKEELEGKRPKPSFSTGFHIKIIDMELRGLALNGGVSKPRGCSLSRFSGRDPNLSKLFESHGHCNICNDTYEVICKQKKEGEEEDDHKEVRISCYSDN